MKRDRAAILALLRRGKRFVITGHVNPDGDAVSSQVGLGLALEALGKSVMLVAVDPVPQNYRFLHGAARFRPTPPRSWRGCDGVLVLDCGDARRAGPLLEPRPPVPVVNIDHHATNPLFGDLNWVDENASSTAELVYAIVTGLGVRPDAAIARALYTGILTDTGSFRHGNATPRAFRIASRLVAAGADPAGTAEAVYESVRFETLRSLGATLSRLHRTPDGRVAWIALSQRALAAFASRAETEEWVNFPRSVDSALIAVCFKESAGGEVRLSFRSKGTIDVAALAARWGGGGHRNAAGATARGPLARVEREVIAAARRHLDAPSDLQAGDTGTQPARPARALARR